MTIDLKNLREVSGCGHPETHYLAHGHTQDCNSCLTLLIDAALKEERERCAKIADAFGAMAGNDSSGGMAHMIAQEISSSRDRENDTLKDRIVQDAKYHLQTMDERDSLKKRMDELEKALHKISCAECTVHDEYCEIKAGISTRCACDPRVAGNAINGYICPVTAKLTNAPSD